MSDFSTLQINPLILKSLTEKGYKIPTPIQLQAIPHLLESKDLLGIAQTGTGKTAAFSLPMLTNLSKNKIKTMPNCLRALILTPTRELASQISENIEIYAQGLHLKHAVIFGGVNINAQIRAMASGIDIIIATPGRLLDLMNQGHINYKQLEILVLDEADRMLDMGFINDIKKIIQKLPVNRQTIFFSATMPKDIAVLAGSILKNPVRIEVTPQSTTVEKINQTVKFVDKPNKLALLKSILNKPEVISVLVFTKTKHGANKVVDFLTAESIKTAAIHGNKSQNAREMALNSFRAGKIKVLIATDIAARGIDVPGVSHVINYDLPNEPESYVHRIGRTARAGKGGIAISFCDRDEYILLKDVEKAIKHEIPVNTSHEYHDKEPRVIKKRIPNGGNRNNVGNRGGNKFAANKKLNRSEKPRSYFDSRQESHKRSSGSGGSRNRKSKY